MSKIILASSLTRYTKGINQFNTNHDTLDDALKKICSEHSELGKYVYINPAELHPFINIYIDNKSVKDLNGLHSKINSNSVIRILPGISGG